MRRKEGLMGFQSSRRHFLAGAAGAAGWSALWGGGAQAAILAEPWGIKLGIATYSLRMFERTEAIHRLLGFGVKYISVKDVHMRIGETAEATRAARAEFDAAGLVVTSGGNVDMNKE